MRVIVNPKYAHLQKEIEEIPRSFQKERDVVYDGRNVLKRIGLGSIDVVVKSFKKPHIINRVVLNNFRMVFFHIAIIFVVMMVAKLSVP